MHDAAGLAPLDEAGVLEDGQVLDEARERHPERFGKLADGMFPALEAGQHAAPGGVGQCAEDGVEPRGLILNHLVQFRPAARAVSSGLSPC